MAMMSDIKYLHQKRLVAGQQIPIEKREHHLVLQVPPTVITRHRAHLDKIMLDLSEISEKPFDLTSVEKLYNSINDYQKNVMLSAHTRSGVYAIQNLLEGLKDKLSVIEARSPNYLIHPADYMLLTKGEFRPAVNQQDVTRDLEDTKLVIEMFKQRIKSGRADNVEELQGSIVQLTGELEYLKLYQLSKAFLHPYNLNKYAQLIRIIEQNTENLVN